MQINIVNGNPFSYLQILSTKTRRIPSDHLTVGELGLWIPFCFFKLRSFKLMMHQEEGSFKLMMHQVNLINSEYYK